MAIPMPAKSRKRAMTSPYCDDSGHPFTGENWRKSVYRPLDTKKRQFRVLWLLPSPYLDAEPECYLKTRDIDDNDWKFGAISYVWGDQTETGFVILNGHRVRMGRNACAVLRHVRHTIMHLKVWIDALCINQADTKERGHQIQLMREIYSRAELAILYICDPTPNAYSALQVVAGITRAVEEHDAFISWDDSFVDSVFDEIEAHNCPDWGQLVQFLQHEFWQRIWIVQERNLGIQNDKILQIGKTRYQWAEFQFAIVMLTLRSQEQIYKRSQPPEGALEARSIALMHSSEHVLVTNGKPDYTRYLECQSSWRCSDARDRVYGMLGILPRLASRVSYDDSVETVYEDATVSIFNDMRSLEAVTAKKFFWTRPQGLASWAINIAHGGRAGLDWVFVRGLYHSDGSAGIHENLRTKHSRLGVAAHYCSTLTSTDSFCSPIWFSATPTIPKPTDSFLQEFVAKCLQSEEIMQAFLIRRDGVEKEVHKEERQRVLLMDSFFVRSARTRGYSRIPRPHDFDEDLLTTWSSLCATNKFSSSRSGSANSLDDCPVHVFTSLHGTRIAIDSSGHLCIVPVNTEPGDDIYILAGGIMPFVLRRADDQETMTPTFRIIGPAYVHGIMDGEAVFDSPKRVSTGDPDAYDSAFTDIWLV